MFIAILQFQMMIDGSTGLKDKRRVVRSIKDRLHKQHMVCVAEVDSLETWNLATMGIVACNRNAEYLRTQMQAIIGKLQHYPGGRLADHELEIIGAEVVTGEPVDEAGKPLWTEQERRGVEGTEEVA
jgi:uncharacterized protein YlxP (DUF503 family)